MYSTLVVPLEIEIEKRNLQVVLKYFLTTSTSVTVTITKYMYCRLLAAVCLFY